MGVDRSRAGPRGGAAGAAAGPVLEEAERRWPGLDDDPDNSPWSSWPLYQPIGGGGTALNLGWSHADTTFPAVVELAVNIGLVVCDPQEEVLHRPER